MSERPVILDQYGKPFRRESPKKAPARSTGRQSRYDAAQTTDENRNHWGAADGLSANAANSPEVRYKLRTRARYEIANNGFCANLVRRRTNDTIGTGPRLQLALPETYTDPDFQTAVSTSPDVVNAVEEAWNRWCLAIDLVGKMRTMARGEWTDGESFAVEINNPALPEVQLDLAVFEADQFATPDLAFKTPDAVDGIRFDRAGNPIEYHLLKQHPGDSFVGLNAFDYDRIPAARVYHLFECLRAGQRRGIPPLTPGMPLAAVLRRFTLAGLHSAEWGACVAGVIEDELGPPDDGSEEADEIEEMDKVPIARNSLLYLGAGRKAHAFDSKQPAPGHRDFQGSVLTEIGAGFGATRSISTNSTAEFNFSSAKLDRLPWVTDVGISRSDRERLFLLRLFRSWLREAQMIPGYLPAGLPPVTTWKLTWHWDGLGSIDPVKDATANEIKKRSGLATDAQLLAEEGKDWREHYAQLAREKAERKRLGLESEPPAPAPQARPEPEPAEEEEENADA